MSLTFVIQQLTYTSCYIVGGLFTLIRFNISLSFNILAVPPEMVDLTFFLFSLFYKYESLLNLLLDQVFFFFVFVMSFYILLPETTCCYHALLLFSDIQE